MKQIKLQTLQYNVDITLKGWLTILCGESATGKSFIYNTINNYKFINNTCDYVCIDVDNIKNKEYMSVINLLKNTKDGIIIIDQANHILRVNEILEFIRKDYDSGNYYLLIGRTLPIGIDSYEFAEPIIENNIISIEYLFED